MRDLFLVRGGERPVFRLRGAFDLGPPRALRELSGKPELLVGDVLDREISLIVEVAHEGSWVTASSQAFFKARTARSTRTSNVPTFTSKTSAHSSRPFSWRKRSSRICL